MSSLGAEEFVLFPRSSAPGLHDTITGMCIATGFSPSVIQEANSWSSVISMVGAGLGITIAPLSAQDLRPKSVVFRTLRGTTGTAELAMAYPAQHLSAIATHFRTIAHAALADRQ